MQLNAHTRVTALRLKAQRVWGHLPDDGVFCVSKAGKISPISRIRET